MSESCLLIVGPTGTGKSQLALEIALKINTGIINADSVQVYRDLVIGAAQPSREDFKIVPHYLYGYISAGKSLTAADYCRDAKETLSTHFSSKIPIFCGGSGFYIQALDKGMYDVPTFSEAQEKTVDEKIHGMGWEVAYAELQQKDPQTKIHGNDHYRIRRALEIIWLTGKRPTELNANVDNAPLKNKKVLKIGLDLDKEKLRQRILQRTKNMLSAGWIEEVEAVIAQGHGQWSALKSVGYGEIVEHLNGQLTQEQMIEKIVISNMQLIKKQRTWFKRDADIHWYTPENTQEAVRFVISQLKG